MLFAKSLRVGGLSAVLFCIACWVGMLFPARVQAEVPEVKVSFPALMGGVASESVAVRMNGQAVLVAVVGVGGDPKRPQCQVAGEAVTVRVIGYDGVSRLQFLEMDGGGDLPQQVWLREVGHYANASLRARVGTGTVECRTTGWVKQVGSKVLPLALLGVSFDGPVPPPGTPLVTTTGSVVGILFQAVGGGKGAYAIPAEAVHRVQSDLLRGGAVIRGWLGLSLRADTRVPQVVRVLPDSPAAVSGAQPGDVLTYIGNRKVAEYADAVNAFFYLIPEVPVRVKLLRGATPMELTLTPLVAGTEK